MSKMPSLFFDVEDIEETKVSVVNASGFAYVGRKYSGKEVTWIKLKECKSTKLDKQLLSLRDEIYSLRQDQYDNPTIQPGFDRLSEALITIANVIKIIDDPQGDL